MDQGFRNAVNNNIAVVVSHDRGERGSRIRFLHWTSHGLVQCDARMHAMNIHLQARDKKQLIAYSI
jgi:hypothetical protein